LLLAILEYTYNKSDFALFVYDYYVFIDVGIILIYALYYWTKYEDRSTNICENPLFYGGILINVLISANATLANVYDRRDLSLILGLADGIIAAILFITYEFVACKNKTKLPILLMAGAASLLLVYRETYVQMSASSLVSIIITITLCVMVLAFAAYEAYIDNPKFKLWELIYVIIFAGATYALFFVLNLPEWSMFVFVSIPLLIGIIAVIAKAKIDKLELIRNLGELLILADLIGETIGYIVLMVTNPSSTTIMLESLVGLGAAVTVHLIFHFIYEKGYKLATI